MGVRSEPGPEPGRPIGGRAFQAEPVVGVLLPVRLETRFVRPPTETDAWKLCLRIVPDAASIDQHDPAATAAELDDVEVMWQDSAGDVTTETGKAAWRRFAGRHGGARAAWLARTFLPQTIDDRITIERTPPREQPTFSRIAGLPPTIEVWLERGGNLTLAATIHVPQGELSLELPDPDAAATPWWSSFEAAKIVGLGAEIDLDFDPEVDRISALYVIGLGGGDPTPLFQAHRDAGNLAIMSTGTATNTVEGGPAANLGHDAETWRRLVAGAHGLGITELSLALTGRTDAPLAPMLGSNSAAELNRIMVSALWPAVFGHGVKDVLGLAGGGQELGVWALDALVPEGPVPPIRIGDQPYGVLPVTSLQLWRALPDDPPVEAELVRLLPGLRARAARWADDRGTTVGADTAKLLDLLGSTPAATGYSWRWFLPLELVHWFGWAFGANLFWPELEGWWNLAAADALALGARPGRRYASLGFPQDLAIPLVVPDNVPGTPLGDLLAPAVDAEPGLLVSPSWIGDVFPRFPNSLLFRLVYHSLVVSAAEVERDAVAEELGLPTGRPFFEPLFTEEWQPTELGRSAAQMTDGMLGSLPSSALFKAVRAWAVGLGDHDTGAVERVFKATLDTAAYRLDPWITGLAWRRLQALASPHRELGIYGWVDDLRPRDLAAPPFADEFLHAPSEAAALTSAILRDRALADTEPDRWQMDVDSDRVRLAEQLAAEVRLGGHIAEVLGRAVERAVATRADVERLRADFPIRTEHAGRRVCDGQAILARYVDRPDSLGLSPDQLARLAPLAAAADVYGDLLVADAVYDVVSGRAALAQSSMEAAAGLAVPPVLDVLRTPREGRAVNTSVVIALPDAAAPAPIEASTSPGRIADPVVAAFLDTAFGAANEPTWTWQIFDGQNPVGDVTLTDLGLAPVDTVSLSATDLTALAAGFARGAFGLGDSIRLEPAGGLDTHARTRRLADLLGRQPVVPGDLTNTGEGEADAAIHADLGLRYADLHQAASLLKVNLQAAVSGTDDDRRAALRNATRWGIRPLAGEDDGPATGVSRAREALETRLRAVPAAADAANLSVPQLATALAELASPEGKIPVLARHRLDQLPVALTAEPAPAVDRDDLDPDWLEVVAAVRLSLARLEAYQLEQRATAATPFAAWTNRPGDPWQTVPPPEAAAGPVPTTRLVAAFGPAGALDPGADPARQVALGLVDSWGETIPATQHATSVAFHFDAPAARAPQAILLAVPPDPERELTVADLLSMLRETRELARARMAIPESLDRFAAAIPLTMLPVASRSLQAEFVSGVSLDPA